MKIGDLIEHLMCLREAHGDLDLYADDSRTEAWPVNVLLKYDAYNEATYVEISIEFTDQEV